MSLLNFSNWIGCYSKQFQDDELDQGNLLLNILMSPGWISRVTVGLAADQNENARCDGKNCQYRAQASESRDKCCQSGENEPDG
jgi:hypothetical protein